MARRQASILPALVLLGCAVVLGLLSSPRLLSFTTGAACSASQAPLRGLVARSAGAGYVQRHWSKYDPEPIDTTTATGATVEVEYKKRPFGIPRYQPGQNGVGARVVQMTEKSRYPGDPSGQAFVAGVKPGWVLKSLNGQDVTGMKFEDIMDLQDDEVFLGMHQALTGTGVNSDERNLEALDLPLKVEYIEQPELVRATPKTVGKKE